MRGEMLVVPESVLLALLFLSGLGDLIWPTRARAASETQNTVSVENKFLRLSVRAEDGEYEILHRSTGQVWRGPGSRLCSITLVPNEGRPIP